MENGLSWQAEADFRVENGTGPYDIYKDYEHTLPVRIMMTGSRDWTDKRSIAAALKRAIKFIGKDPKIQPFELTLVHGDASGADRLTARIAEEYFGMFTEAHPADWSVHNKSCPTKEPSNGSCWKGRASCKRAGFRRNQEMIDSGAQLLLAFVKDNSRGSTGTLNIWLKEGRPAIICRQSGESSVKGEFVNMDRFEGSTESFLPSSN